jgi:adenosylcobinamide-GDP ribazoletransferase
MKSFFFALRFLTILPVPERWATGGRSFAPSVFFFPLIGLIIGIFAAGIDAALTSFWPVFPASALTVVIMIAASGALHMDGLADTADGFFSVRSRDEMLAIMRDSRTGAMGVIAVVIVISLKIAFLASVPPCLRWGTILLMPLAGRSALVILMAVLSYVRKDQGLASVFRGNHAPYYALWSTAVLLGTSWAACRWRGLLAGAISVASVLFFAAYTHKKIGGYTGDTLGAGCELAEIVPAVVGSIQ